MNRILAPLLFLNNLFLIGYCLFTPLKNYSILIISLSILMTIVLTIVNNSVQTTFNCYLRNMNRETIKSLFLDLLRFRVLLGIPLFYPVVETFFGISCFFWEPIKTFAGSLPYCFNPNTGLFSWVCFNLIIFIIMGMIPRIDSEFKHIGPILSLVLLYSFFDEQFFDLLIHWSGIVGGIILAILILGSAGAGGTAGSSTSAVNSYDNDSNNNTFEADKTSNIANQKERNEKHMKEFRDRIEENKKEQYTIGCARQNGRYVQVYNTKRHFLFQRPGVLTGYTSDTVSIKGSDGHIKVYKANGNYLYSA